MINRPPALTRKKILIAFAIAVGIEIVIVGAVTYIIHKVV